MGREQLIKTLRREGFSGVPVDVELCESQISRFEERYGHRDYPSFFGEYHRPLELEIKPNFEDGTALYPREKLPGNIDFDEYGVGHSQGSEMAFHMTRMHHPLKGAGLNEIMDFPYPTVSKQSQENIHQQIRYLHENDLAAYAKMQMTIWEASWYLRSMEELMMDMMMGDEKAIILLDKITDFACYKARIYAESGADILGLGDDIGTQKAIMMDVELWRKWLKPRLMKVIVQAREAKPDILIFYHSCGYIIPFINDLIEIGIDILNPVQPECMDFNDVHDHFGDHLSFWGTIGTQDLLPFGTYKDVKSETISRLKKCGEKGGIVIGPTHLVEPDVPWENLLAITDGVREFERMY